MSLGKLIVQQVLARSSDQMAEKVQKRPYFIEAVEGPINAKVELEDADRLGCLAMSLQVERTEPEKAVAPLPVLRLKAEQITQRLGYLLEDLEIVEIDCREGVCQIRSAPVEVADFYYELMLEAGGRATLLRYEKSTAEMGRAPRGMNLSLEVLQRLIDDMAAAV